MAQDAPATSPAPRRAWRARRSSAPADSGAPALPCLLAAYGFEERAPGPSHWGQGLSGARLWLPRLLAMRGADGQGWMVAARALTAADHDSARIAERLIADPPAISAGPTMPWLPLRTDFQEQVEDAVSLIRDGAMRKVVLARAVDQALPGGFDAPAVLGRLARLPAQDATVYAHDNDDGSLFIGASPELLFEASDNRITAMALAGSVARGASPAEDQELLRGLMDSTKQRKEHGVVVEHLVATLQPRCHPFKVPEGPHPRPLSTITHLETVLEAELRQQDYLELLGALQPTPAVCGLPTATAAHYIRRHEGLHRGLYTGALGWTTPSACRFIVPLRCAIVRQEAAGARARLFAGAGLVETSDPATEFSETELKLAVMRAVLG